MMGNPKQLLAIPDKFRQTAMALPDKVRQAVALLDDPDDLDELLAKTEAMAVYTRHLQQSTEVNNALQFARLVIQSGLGRVMPAEKGGRGKTKNSPGGAESFGRDVLTAFRKVHRNDSRLDGYRQQIDEHNAGLDDGSPDAVEIVEETTDRRFAKEYLDKYAGVDCWQVIHGKSQMRGIARRVQRPIRKLFRTFTLRHSNGGPYRCEFEKRLESMTTANGWLRPALMVQAYLTPLPANQLLAVGIAYMDDLITIVAEGERGTGFHDPKDWYMRSTKPGVYAESEKQYFAVVPFETLERRQYKAKWIIPNRTQRQTTDIAPN